MKQAEIDNAIFEWRNFIAERFKDVQMVSQTLKNPEDKDKNYNTFVKITDCFNDCRRAYDNIMRLENEVPDPEEEDMWSGLNGL